LHFPEESKHANHQDQRSNTESITNQYNTNTNIKRESENKQLNGIEGR